MKPHTDNVVERPADLTAAWLTAAIDAGTIADFTVERIGTGQMSECYRVGLTYTDGGSRSGRPGSVVLKVAATDPMSRQTGVTLGLYEREVHFYRDIAPRLRGPVAPCYHAACDAASGIFDVLLGDANPAVVGDEIRGATTAQAQLAVTELARLQGPLLGDTTLADAPWLHRDTPVTQALITALHAGFVDRYGDQIAPHHRMVCERLVGGFDDYLAEEAADGRIHGLVHGDYRLDNMLFGAAGADRPLTVVDWQTVTWGPAMTDLAYFLGCALPVAERRKHYDALLDGYHTALGPDAPISLADVREGVRRQSFFGVMMAIVSSMLVERTERGDAMFMTMLQRHCEHVLDTDALACSSRCEGPHRFAQNRSWPFALTLQSVAAVEASKNPLLRDFRHRSVFDFCNNICQQPKSRGYSITSSARPSNVAGSSRPGRPVRIEPQRSPPVRRTVGPPDTPSSASSPPPLGRQADAGATCSEEQASRSVQNAGSASSVRRVCAFCVRLFAWLSLPGVRCLPSRRLSPSW